MGEAIISRAGGGSSGGSKEDIPSDIGILLFTLDDSSGNPISSFPVHCKDGDTWYNYSTNSNGQILFSSLKSGLVNMYLPLNYANGTIIADQTSNTYYEVECPLGKNVKNTISFAKKATPFNLANGTYSFLVMNTINLNMSGGGGGSGGTFIHTTRHGTYRYYGGSGGGAKTIIQNNLAVNKNNSYQAIIGSIGGSGGSYSYDIETDPPSATGGRGGDGRSGGTSSFFGYSAVGGGGGEGATIHNNASDGTSYGSWHGAGYISIS